MDDVQSATGNKVIAFRHRESEAPMPLGSPYQTAVHTDYDERTGTWHRPIDPAAPGHWPEWLRRHPQTGPKGRPHLLTTFRLTVPSGWEETAEVLTEDHNLRAHLSNFVGSHPGVPLKVMEVDERREDTRQVTISLRVEGPSGQVLHAERTVPQRDVREGSQQLLEAFPEGRSGLEP